MTVLEFPSDTSPRRRPRKSPAKQEATREVRILEQCAVYLQSMAAYRAVDQMDNDLEILMRPGGPCTQHFKAADQALRKLVGLSPAHKPGCPPLTPKELKAKAVVCRVMEKEATDELTCDERLYVRFFAQEVEDFLATVGTDR